VIGSVIKFMSPNKEKLALFIDGANLYATAKSVGFVPRDGRGEG
jgi:hypothetical protein